MSAVTGVVEWWKRHAFRHARQTGHPIVASYEPGEDWWWNYQTNQYTDGPALAPPHHHPLDQPTPGPAGEVPEDWERQLR